jgi:hypothetical protein
MPTNGLKAATPLLLALSVLTCGEPAGRWAGTVTDSAGVTIVSNPGDGTWTAAERWTVEQDLRIGSVAGEPEYQFGQVGGITVDSRGRIFVLDAQAQVIRVYSPDGEYETTFGAQGSGPGELRGATFLLIGPGDTLLVPDVQNERVNRYAPDGTSLGSFPLRLQDGLPMMFRASAAGLLAMQVRPFALPGQPAPENPEDAIVVFRPDGTVIDTVMAFPSGRTFSMAGPAPEIRIYAAEPVWNLTDDGKLLFGVNDEYRIGVYTLDGGLQRIVAKEFERKPVTERDKRAIMKFLERTWTEAGVPPAALDQLRGLIKFGDYLPAFASFTGGPQGTIWVQHVRTGAELTDEEIESFNPMEEAGSADWDVFDSEGRYLGVVTLPDRFAPRLFRDDKIYGVWRDELDVQYVVRLRVVVPASSEEAASPAGSG